MKTGQLKFNLIDKLIALRDPDLLHKVEKLLSKIKVDNSETFKLTSAQKEMLKASEADIKNGRTISDRQVNDEEDKWLRE